MPRPSSPIPLILFSFLATTACSSTMYTPALNPHPTQRYELTVTANAPGPWDRVSASVTYAIRNTECTPKNRFMGVHELPDDVNHTITLTRVDAHTYTGYFYRDLLQGGDYYGLGFCHWDLQAVGPDFVAHGLSFSASMTLNDILATKPVTQYFRKKEYLDHSMNDENAGAAMLSNTEDTPGEWFPVTMTAREIKP